MNELEQLLFLPVPHNRTRPMPKDRRDPGKDPLPYESIYSFTEYRADFEEMVLKLTETAENLYFRTRVLNRYSLDYPEYCVRLQDSVKKLGSCLLTMEFFEQQGRDLSELRKALSMDLLFSYASFNFRKCHAAADGSKDDSVTYFLQAANMEFAWASILQRLEATEKRIGLIREGKIKFDNKTAAVKERPADEKETGTNEEDPQPLRAPAAFPVMKDCLKGKAVNTAETPREKTGPDAVPDETADAESGARLPEGAELPETESVSADVPEEDRLIGTPEPHLSTMPWQWPDRALRSAGTRIPPGQYETDPDDLFFDDDWDYDKPWTKEDLDWTLDQMMNDPEAVTPEVSDIFDRIMEDRRNGTGIYQWLLNNRK